VGARGRRPPWSPPWVPVTLGHCEVLYVLFFLIFYSLFGPCPPCPFIFSYLLLFIWHLPSLPFYFSLSFTLYLAPALPALLFSLIFYSLFGPCPSRTALPCPARQTDRRTLPYPLPRPALFGRPFFQIPGPVFRIRLSGPVPPRQLKHETVVGQTDEQTDRHHLSFNI